MIKPLGGWSSTPDPAGGAYSAPPDLLAGGENPTSAVSLSGLIPLGLWPLVSRPQVEFLNMLLLLPIGEYVLHNAWQH